MVKKVLEYNKVLAMTGSAKDALGHLGSVIEQ
jgi:hypothetical protein